MPSCCTTTYCVTSHKADTIVKLFSSTTGKDRVAVSVILSAVEHIKLEVEFEARKPPKGGFFAPLLYQRKYRKVLTNKTISAIL